MTAPGNKVIADAATPKSAAIEQELVESLREIKEVLRFALLCTTPDIARDGMEFIRKAEAVLAKAGVA